MSLLDELRQGKANNNNSSLLDEIRANNQYENQGTVLDEIRAQKPQQPESTPKEDSKGFFGSIGDMVSGVGKSVGQLIGPTLKSMNPFDDYDGADLIKKKPNLTKDERKGVDEFLNFSAGAMDATTFGLGDTSGYSKGGVSGIAGQLAGSLVPGAGIAAGLRGTRLGANVTRNMSIGQKGLQYAKEGVAAGAIFGGLEAGITEAINPDERNLGQHLGNIALETGFGAVADPAIMGAMSGISRGAKRIWNSDKVQNQNAFIGRDNQIATNDPSRLRPESNNKTVLDQMRELNQPYNVMNNPVGNVELPTYSPTQSINPTTKSYTQPRITMPNDGDYLSFRSKVDREPKNKDKFSSTYQKLRTQFIDDLAPLETFEKNIRGEVGNAENSLYKQGRLFRGSPEKSHNFVRTQIQPIIKQVEDAGYSYEDLGDYALAVHAKDVNARGMNSGFTNAEVDSVIRQLGNPQMEQARQRLVDVSTQLLRVLEDSQVLEKGAADFLRQRWPNYMPLFRSFDDDKIEFGQGLSRSLANASNPIKRLEGSDRNVIDPIESMVKNTFKTFNVADRNNVALQLSQLAAEDTAGNFVRKVQGDTSRKNVVSVMENGKKVKYEVPPEVYETIVNLNQESSNLLIKMLQKPASWLRAGATLDPVFSLRNPMRDIVQAYVVSNSKFNPIRDFPAGLVNAIFKGRKVNIGGKEITLGKFYDDFVNSNGGYGNIVSMDRNLHRKALQQGLNEKSNVFLNVLNPNTYMNVLRAIADASENAIKIGEFRAAKRRGVSNEEAAYRARDIMDFNRAGTSIREANKVIAFLNANIQGKSRLIRAIVGNPVRTTARSLTAVGLPTVAFFVASQHLSNDTQRKTIEDAPQWMKETFWLTPIPGTDMVARIPKPFDLTYISNTLERVLDYVVKNDKQAFDGWAKELARGQALPVMMTGLAPFVEGMANYSFFMGGPIIPQREQNLEYPDQHDINTTGTARFIAEQINKVTGGEGTFANFGSPRIIDNTIQGLTAGLGNYATSAIDSIFFDDYYDKPEKASKDFVTEETPLRGFLVNSMSSGQSMSELYDLRDQLRRQQGSAKQNNEPFNDGAKLNYVESITKQISDISKVMRNVENDKNMSGEQKRARLEELNQRRNDIARQAWDNVR